MGINRFKIFSNSQFFFLFDVNTFKLEFFNWKIREILNFCSVANVKLYFFTKCSTGTSCLSKNYLFYIYYIIIALNKENDFLLFIFFFFFNFYLFYLLLFILLKKKVLQKKKHNDLTDMRKIQ